MDSPELTTELYHIGVKRRSGRYPYGSGDNPYQHEDTFLGQYYRLKFNDNLSDKEIMERFGMSSTEFRAKRSVEQHLEREWNRSTALRLLDEGWSKTAIGNYLGMNESSVRSLLKDDIADRQQILNSTATAIKDRVDKYKYVDIGKGTESIMGVSKTKLDSAVQKLVDEGYSIQTLKVEQPMTGHDTTLKVLVAPGVTWKEVMQNKENIALMTGVKSYDGGRTYAGMEPPTSISSSRIYIRYPSEGGAEREGTIELRRGIDELSLGNANYAQVRIAVDGTHYLKGMAVYGNDIPPGYDIVFNTSKKDGTPAMLSDPKAKQVFKPLSDDKDNPFGSLLKEEDGVIVGQRHYIDKEGNDKLSPVNIVREEADWDRWSNSLASQMLSKQPYDTAKRQLGLAASFREDEFETIMSLEQPEVKRAMLNSFADGCDSDAAELKAASLPRQATKVILPVPSLKDNEIYAPSFVDGEEVILIRYPHGGIFEIPKLKVVTKSKEGRAILGDQPIDAVGINATVAAHLSGADFDGDTVLVIPTKGQNLRSAPYLEQLKDFDDKAAYPAYEGMHQMTDREHGLEMGKVTNLITDMTIMGADDDEIARAVRHSMVVVDAKKHNLNYKKSYEDNRIAELNIKYRGSANAGAATIISKASSEKRVDQRKPISADPETGEKRWEYTGKTYSYKKDLGNGEYEIITKKKQDKSTKMAEASDAYELTFGGSRDTAYKMETAYADYANRMKALANTARKEALSVKSTSRNPEASKEYSREVSSLMSALNEAKKNSPLERKAVTLANIWIEEKKRANPHLKDKDNADQLKKVKIQCMNEARIRVGAKRPSITISDREWEAIMNGAFSSTALKEIFHYVSDDELKRLATPRTSNGLSSTKQARIRSLMANGYTISEIANQLGVSTSTVTKYAKQNKGLGKS